MTRYFDSFEHALNTWGRYAAVPYKLTEARRAYHQMVELLGAPSTRAVGRNGRENPGPSGTTPFYSIDSGQYVAVLWWNKMHLQLQTGFIAATERLTDAWELSPRPRGEGSGGEAWWRINFPDHVEFGKADESAAARYGECACSPGMRQPLGQPCYRCEEPVV